MTHVTKAHGKEQKNSSMEESRYHFLLFRKGDELVVVTNDYRKIDSGFAPASGNELQATACSRFDRATATGLVFELEPKAGCSHRGNRLHVDVGPVPVPVVPIQDQILQRGRCIESRRFHRLRLLQGIDEAVVPA